MHPGNISIKDYSYDLPEDRIAHYPLEERDASRLLIYKNGNITEDIFRKIDEHLPGQSLLVFNNTKVAEARLLFKKPTGAIIEIFCLEPGDQYPDISSAMSQKEKVLWKCLIGGASKWKHGQILEKKITAGDKEITLRAAYIEKQGDHFIIELKWSPEEMSFAELLHHTGVIPLPPYIKRETEETDAIRYQTIYAQHEGSVAAPTAGLHFTDTIFEKLNKKKIQADFVTLHVGAGTFRPVKSETMKEHEMHAEYIEVSRATIENILHNADKAIIAIGTTSLRTIESLYWMGVKLAMRNHSAYIPPQQATPDREWINEIFQWEVYDNLDQNIPATEALQLLLDRMRENKLDRVMAKTGIIIAPGYKLRIVKGLITNFHLPGSTLLLLVAALTGDNWKNVYDYALQNGFRFLSYGDGSLLWADE